MEDEEEILRKLSYNPHSGIFLWEETNYRKTPLTCAGNLDKSGYIRIHVVGRKVAAHRLAWFFSHGEWPQQEVDHINGDKSDNRINNLRLVTRSQNQMNSDKSKGFGVDFYKKYGLWRARITKDSVVKHLGYFETKEKAKCAYLEAKQKLHKEYGGY